MIEILNGLHETIAYEGIYGMKIYHNLETENYPLHWHTVMEIIMPQENYYTLIYDGSPITFDVGDIMIITPGTLHELAAPPSGARIIMQFDYTLISNIKGMDSVLHMMHPYYVVRQSSQPKLCGQLCSCLNQIIEEFDSNSPFMEANAYSLMINFFITFGRANLNAIDRFPGTTTNKHYEYVEKFMNVCKYINDHCTEDLTIDVVADYVGFSKFHFSRLFKQFTNVTYYDYLTQKRISHAEKLLITPDLSITEVAMQSGFNSLSTFNRIFKAMKNCTPSEYKTLNYQAQKAKRILINQ